ncbi:CerR family C-terminal domain-containing protein [Methylococcus geothermalis]|uniref:DUF1956 domain-containing protein n=1 Tax=Methylococcus geothermalis TaxID=2681310 RepID=A0A858Q8V8_9GAMM|nr:CerR family C-terminal domain-containing protein [Methylococcus geothermalis]QJD30308.1 DUF1956 domain-containing protein [Methylococcus geothermalis]
MNPPNAPLCQDPTRERLLQAALDVFADKGFRNATVRDICARAEVNAASVNYYFRSKEALYSEVLAVAFRETHERYPDTLARDASLPPEMRLRHFIANFLARLLDETHLGRHGKLIAREIADPTAALDQVIETTMKPRCALLQGIVAELVGPGVSEAGMHRLGLSIVGQCLMYRHSRSLIDRLCPDIIATPEEIGKTADLIARFSIAALKHLPAGEAGS